MDTYILPQLLVLIPFLMGLAQVIKPYLADDAKPNIIKNTLKSTKRIPYILWIISVLISTAYGFIYNSGYAGGLDKAIYAVLIVGILHGSVVAWTAMGLYDTAKAAKV
ncbi:hypothetical protein [Parasphaerochaeta coccoides]|uniref:Uncharacterized protein n=1 Tax=Parasphaerochaeta coccoides (strain ATCC BAA-1237 / DSM 17374 / SPN1) TaxID=760011 RepID=F4GHE8_PARC1|nr:hypothetical protein [Parasphaerochaeta coccoides]AEC02047.1 hypothetical protein Spico_0823 [Parasphaerochaeta coccoides DSM 17374]